ncbi:MAG: hypothetical protein U1E62_21570 [Alsobacter sp.]
MEVHGYGIVQQQEPMVADGKQISGEVLVALLREAQSAASRVAEINGNLGDRVKHHKDHSNLHTGAFAIIKKMARMEELKRDAFWAALSLYKDIADEKLWDRHSGDLADMAVQSDDAEHEADEDVEAAKRNEAALRRGISELPEDADDAPKPGERRRSKPKTGGGEPGTYKLN